MKLVGSAYKTYVYVDTTVVAGDEYSTSLWVRNAFVSSNAVTLADETTNNIMLNGTSVNHVYDEGDTIDIVSKEVALIKGLSIPFVYEDADWKDGTVVKDGKVTYSDALKGFNYEWLFNLPTTTVAESDTLTYSSTNITLRSWYDGSFFGLFTSRGSDKLDDVDTKKVSTTASTLMDNRAWSYGVESSLTVDTDYEVKIRVGNLPDSVLTAMLEKPGLVYTEPGTWLNWITYHFWNIIAAATALLTGAKASSGSLKGSIPKLSVDLSWLVPAPMGLSVPAPIMMSGRRSNRSITYKGDRVSPTTRYFAIGTALVTLVLVLGSYLYPTSIISLVPNWAMWVPAAAGYILLGYDSKEG